MDLETKTIEELLALQTALHAQSKALQAQRKAVAGELERRALDARARQVVDALSDAERAALRQVIGATGIPSGEAHGTPGT